MISNEIVVNYKVVYLIEFYNFAFGHFPFRVVCTIQKIEFQNLSASNRILGLYMISNEKVINYKVVGCIEIYNFDTKIVFI